MSERNNLMWDEVWAQVSDTDRVKGDNTFYCLMLVFYERVMRIVKIEAYLSTMKTLHSVKKEKFYEEAGIAAHYTEAIIQGQNRWAFIMDEFKAITKEDTPDLLSQRVRRSLDE